MRLTAQQSLDFTRPVEATRGGKREGAGRPKKKGKRPVPHAPRAIRVGRRPAHVTLRVRGDVPRLRRWKVLAQLRAVLKLAARRDDFRIVHVSLQGNHVHLIVEADDATALGRGMQGFAISLAKRINALYARRGAVFAGRYYAKDITSPTQMNRTLAYVLKNFRRHGEHEPRLDPFSSAVSFRGWTVTFDPPPPESEPLEVCRPQTWLADEGWRRGGGEIDPWTTPGPVN